MGECVTMKRIHALTFTATQDNDSPMPAALSPFLLLYFSLRCYAQHGISLQNQKSLLFPLMTMAAAAAAAAVNSPRVP